MENLNYNPVSFQGIVPVLDVGDPSASLASAYQYSLTDQNAILNRMKDSAAVEQRNMETKMKGFQDLMKFSQSAVKEVTKIKNEQTKQEAANVWAEAYNNYEAPEQVALAEEYGQQEQQQNERVTDVETTLSTNLNKKKEVTVQDSADAAKIRKRTGLMEVVAANARAEAAMESYKPALDNYVSRVNAARAERGEPMIEPGADYNMVKTDFDRKWSDKTGMSMANPGYTAKYVYPKLRREAAASLETYTKGFNIQQAAITTEDDLQRLQDGELSVNDFFTAQRGLTGRDGKTLKNNSDVWQTLSQADLPPEVLSKLGSETNPTTGKSYSSHPRWKTLQIDARKRRNDQWNLGRKEYNRTAVEAFNTVDNYANASAVRDELLAMGLPADIVNNAYSSAMSSTERKMRVKEETARINNLLDEKGPEYKLTAADMDGVPNELWNTFAGRLSPNANAEQTETLIRESETFKSIGKDFENIVAQIDPNIKFANALTGTKGPTNGELFKQESLSRIALGAQALMLGEEGLTMDQAVKQSTANWRQEQQELVTKNEFFDIGRNNFKSSFTEANLNAREKMSQQITALRNTTATKLETGLYDSDYLAPPDGRYSERVRFLGRQFGKTPSEIVAMARQQKNLPPLEPTKNELALSEMPLADRAKIASLGEDAPIHLAIRGQITSGQVLQGSASQRTVSVGQQILNMGYGGIWQHPDFHYDTGYTGSGKERVGSHAQNSYHDYGEALDIGVQANGPERLEQLYQYLLKNKQRFGIAELFYDPDGSRGHVQGHANHIHVGFGGGDEGQL